MMLDSRYNRTLAQISVAVWRQSIWATSHRMPTLLWLCQGQHPEGLKESIGPTNPRRIAVDAEVGRYMSGVRR